MERRTTRAAVWRVTVTLLAGTLVALGAACGRPTSGALPGPATTEPATSPTTSEPPTTTEPEPGTDDALTIDTLAPDDLVLRIGREGSNGEDEPRLVSVHADGTVIVPDGDASTRFASFRIGARELGHLLDLVAAAGVYDDVDYGEVEVTDIGSTVVTVVTDRGATEVDVWALDMADGLSADQTEARARLTAVVDALAAAEGAAAQAAALEPYVPATLQLQLAAIDPDPDDEHVPAADWPLEGVRPEKWRLTPWRAACLPVTADEIDDRLADGHVQEWSLPATDAASPPAVRVRIEAVLPGDEPCDGAPAFGAPRPLTDQEAESPTSRTDTPWPADRITTVHPLEAWAAEAALLTEVLPSEIADGGTWDPTRWSWFDVGIVGVELDGRRFVDVTATCTTYVTDEEPACTILARFDAGTGELTELSAS